MIPPKRVADRLEKSLAKFQQVLLDAKNRDVSESDTVFIIGDMLADLFGYDKFLEVTSELEIKGTYCDLAIKVDNQIEFLIEVKAIGTNLKDNHLNQAINYGANKGVQWVILTNGLLWRVYKIRFEQPIGIDLVCEFDIASIDRKSEEDQERLFIICKEGINKDAREQFYERTQCLNRFMLGALIMSDDIVSVIRREFRKLSDGFFVTPEEIKQVLENEVLKRDVIEGEDAKKAQSRVRRFYRKTSKENVEGSASDSLAAQDQPDSV